MILHSKHPFYRAWYNLKDRCKNPKSPSYSWYGARGISYDPDWELFKNFYVDMFPSWKEGLSIDRIDNDGNYSKDNCKWSTKSEQAGNKRIVRPSHCLRGHEFTSEDTIQGSSHRRCKICAAAWKAAYKAGIPA